MHDRTITDDQTTVDVTSPIGDADGDAVGAVVFKSRIVVFPVGAIVGADVCWFDSNVGARTVTKPAITIAAPMYCRALYRVRRRRRDMTMLTCINAGNKNDAL